MDREQRRQLKRERSGKFGPVPHPVPTEVRVPTEGVPILWVEATGVERCGQGHYCEKCKVLTRVEAPLEDWKADFPDPRPSTACRQCGELVPMSSRSLDTEYHAPSTGEIYETQRELPIGAIWAQRPFRDDGTLHNWISNRDVDGSPFPDPEPGKGRSCRLIERLHPDDGRVLVCKLPDGHDWVIDSRCNNCTHPLDDAHWCWNRSGKPEDGTLDVRKGKPGQTACNAGGGSIQTGRWHGFLHGGKLVQC